MKFHQLSKEAKRVAIATIKAFKYRDENWREYKGDLYCKHGIYIGTWWGPDYLCGACEDGISDYEYAIGCAYEAQRAINRQAWNEFTDVILEFGNKYANKIDKDTMVEFVHASLKAAKVLK